METRFKLAVLLSLVSACLACSGPTVTPDAPPAAFDADCANPPTFHMTVTQGNAIPVISLPAGYLVVNGEMLRMTPTNGTWGPYVYQGNVPYDGEVRYRYVFRYTSGTSNGTDMAASAPNSYVVRPMGRVTWSSSLPPQTIPDSLITGSASQRPRRWISMTDTFPPSGFSGTRTQASDLLVHNSYGYPVSVSAPTIVDRHTGAPISGLTIANSSGMTSGYVVNVPDSTDVRFTITAQAAITNSQPVLWEAGIRFPITIGVRTCWFGPIWADIAFFSNPS